LLASIIVHAVVGAFFVQALVMKRPLFDIFNLGRHAAPDRTQAVHYVTLGTPGAIAPSHAAPASGGSGRRVPVPKLVPPTVIPTTLPPPPKTPPPPKLPPGFPTTGPLIGGNGVLSGIQPHYSDPRLWKTAPDVIVAAPKTRLQQMDSLTNQDIQAYNDSLGLVAQNQRAPGDWTVQKGGQKYGIDKKFIRLGPISIPTAVLALLPLNITGNPMTIERERNYDAMQRDIELHAHQAMNEAEFNKEVRALRQRKDRERAEREKARAAQHDSQHEETNEHGSAPASDHGGEQPSPSAGGPGTSAPSGGAPPATPSSPAPSTPAP
jgi:hypothetical protein